MLSVAVAEVSKLDGSNIIPCCSDQPPIHIITAYMANGDLRTFLRACRPELAQPRASIRQPELFAATRQCVAALVFLERQHVVHRALAARHFLVGRDIFDVRLFSFSRSKDIYLVSFPS
jgi:hypothetical protein